MLQGSSDPGIPWNGALNPHIGSEKAAQISLKAYRENLTLRDAVLRLRFVTAGQFDAWVRPEDMVHSLAPQKHTVKAPVTEPAARAS